MKRITTTIIASLFAAAACRTVPAAETNSPSRLDYASFRIIPERNIFNPNRSARSGRGAKTEPEKRARVESFALVGTMSYENGRFAFFEGSSSQYRQVLKPADTIAGYKVADIAPNLVRLESTNGQTIELSVGMQMKKQDEEEWSLAGARVETTATTGTLATAGEKVESSSGGGESDVLRKLLEKREQELNNEKR